MASQSIAPFHEMAEGCMQHSPSGLVQEPDESLPRMPALISEWDHTQLAPTVAGLGRVVPLGRVKLHRRERTRDAVREASQQLHRGTWSAEIELVGRSAVMWRLGERIERVAATNSAVLIRGESGVGKELVSRAIHLSSARRTGPFVCLNGAALTETLVESQLFGHEKGAFSGAADRRIGKFEAADKGTLLLDEIGEMSPATQAKFLRILEGHPFERVGGSQPVRVDVRVLAATNRDLEEAVRNGQFRGDLYHRLRVLEIRVPPLRERIEDVPELATYFLEKLRRSIGRTIAGFAPAAIEKLRRHSWEGNVRELRNVIERAVVFAQSEMIDAEDITFGGTLLESERPESAPSAAGQVLTLKEIERNHILSALQANGWNKSRAATCLAIQRSTLDRKIQSYRLTRSQGMAAPQSPFEL